MFVFDTTNLHKFGRSDENYLKLPFFTYFSSLRLLAGRSRLVWILRTTLRIREIVTFYTYVCEDVRSNIHYVLILHPCFFHFTSLKVTGLVTDRSSSMSYKGCVVF